MSQQSLEQFLATVIQDEEMISRIGDDVDTIEALIAFGSEQDFEFTEEDLQEFVELTDDELGSVAGGTMMKGYMKNLEQVIPAAADAAVLAQINLQDKLQKQQETLQLLSSTIRMMHDTRLAKMRNLKS